MSFRFQVVGGLLAAVFLPAFIRGGFTLAGLLESPQPNTMAGAAAAIVLGYFFQRKLVVFPGVQAGHYILPAYTASFLVLVLIFFFFRLDYTRLTLITSFLVTCIWFLLMGFLQRQSVKSCLAIVPGGGVGNLEQIKGVDWVRLTSPDDALGGGTGVVADLRAPLSPAWEHFLAEKSLSGTPVFHVKQIRESLLGKVEIEHLSENTLGALTPNQAYIEIKQALDRVGALLFLFFFSPIFLIIAVVIKLDSPGPVLFKQTRKGYRGVDFTVYKFRTMTDRRDVAAASGKSQGMKAATDEHVRGLAVTRAGDQRITRVGRFLRRSRLDELPQLINILRDEMSWIGPRPEALILSKWYEEELPFYSYRHIVRPGITGWAQVNQGHVAEVGEVHEKLHYDFYYIKHFSFSLDVLITFRTITTMLTGFGAR